jgi:hypothetical protein
MGDSSPNSKLTLRELLPVVFSKAMLSFPLRMLCVCWTSEESTSVVVVCEEPLDIDDWIFLLLLLLLLLLLGGGGGGGRGVVDLLLERGLFEVVDLLNRLLDGRTLLL